MVLRRFCCHMLPPCSLMENRPASSRAWLSSRRATHSTWVEITLLPFSAVQAQVTICPSKKVLISARESQSLWDQALRCCCDLSQLTQPVASLARSLNAHGKTVRSQSRTMYFSCKELYTCVEGCWRMLKDVEGCWRMLKDVEGCWRMLKDVEGRVRFVCYCSSS